MTFSVVQGILKPEYGSMIQIDTNCWFSWLTENKSFRYESNNYRPFTVRKEKSDYWYGYRKVAGKLHKRYIGRSLEVTQKKLELVAEELDSQTESKTRKVTLTVTQSVSKAVTDAVTHERILALETRLQLMEERLGKIEGLSETPAEESLRPDLEEELEMVEQAAQGWLDIASRRLEALEKAQEEVAELQEKLAAADRLISPKNQEIADINARLVVANQKISERDDEIERLESELASRSEEVSLSSAPIVIGAKLPEPADLLNQLKRKRKKSKADLGDIVSVLEILEGEE